MNPKPTIAVDVDEVLFPMAPTFLEYHNEMHGTALRFDQLTSYFIEDLTGETTEQMLEKIKTYLKTKRFSLGEPIPGAVEAIRRLREKHRLVLITARDAFFRGHTEEFIEKHFSGLFDELRYTHRPESPDVAVPKYVICEEMGASVLIDDHLHNVAACARAGLEGILFGSYPWNQADELPEGVRRLLNWQEVAEYFDGR